MYITKIYTLKKSNGMYTDEQENEKTVNTSTSRSLESFFMDCVHKNNFKKMNNL